MCEVPFDFINTIKPFHLKRYLHHLRIHMRKNLTILCYHLIHIIWQKWFNKSWNLSQPFMGNFTKKPELLCLVIKIVSICLSYKSNCLTSELEKLYKLVDNTYHYIHITKIYLKILSKNVWHIIHSDINIYFLKSSLLAGFFLSGIFSKIFLYSFNFWSTVYVVTCL